VWLVPVVRARCAALLEALAAVNRLVHRRDEWNLSFLATIAADCRVHGALAAAITAAATATAAVATVVALSLACRAACRATLRFGVAAFCIKRLLAGSKGKCLATVAAGKRSIHV
jgi:hypothetical protein